MQVPKPMACGFQGLKGAGYEALVRVEGSRFSGFRLQEAPIPIGFVVSYYCNIAPRNQKSCSLGIRVYS